MKRLRPILTNAFILFIYLFIYLFRGRAWNKCIQ